MKATLKILFLMSPLVFWKTDSNTQFSKNALITKHRLVDQQALTHDDSTHYGAVHIGKASWYGGFFHGRETASGQTFNKNEMTVAHKTLPFGTKVRITNRRNGKSVVVTVNDRGPYVKSRQFDLSKAAFRAIASSDHGVISIDYQVIG